VDPAVIVGWVERIRSQIERFLAFEGPAAATVVNNLEWTGTLSTIAFLRDIGKHFSVSRMLGKEVVSARLEAGGISYTEFSYQVLQALDYLELYRRHGCTLQQGGSDQWGNLTAGVDLIRRVEGATVHALATPLITRADGTKYGKTEGGAVWLDPEMMSPYAFYQYFVNQADADVGALLRVFSFRSRSEIEALDRVTLEHPERRTAQRALAEELTALVHGEHEAERAKAASWALFGEGDLAGLDEATLAAAFAELPRTTLGEELPGVIDLLVGSGLSESRGAAKRAIAEGGVYLNNRRVGPADPPPSGDDLLHGRWLLLRRGRHTLGVAERER
jgi:tyrosyl-tRNA synthetase